jgi:CRP-like cAMP-binding protein/phosphoribosyl 1,2-cyclic phosphodiesterase
LAAPQPAPASPIIHLPRGGIYVRTSAGPVQIGLPPETIKDSMALGLSVPTFYVVPRELFDRRRGINVSEFEFPTYFNFFILKRKVKLLVDDESIEARIRAVFQESAFGPAGLPHDGEFAEGLSKDARPDFAKETGYFRKSREGARMDVDSLVEFVRYDANGRHKVSEMVNIQRTRDGYVVEDGDEEIAFAPDLVELPPRKPAPEPSAKPFEPPAFGVTILGASHGFDPEGKTTGFVLWVGHRGLLVDPPCESTELFRQWGIAPKLIDGVILTHCHADHDSGTFQKILEEGRINLYTTPYILGSFLRKYTAISGLTEDLLRRTFSFNPVKIGAPTRVHGAELWFFYTLHSIPTIGLKVFYGGRSLAFSADSLYDPPRVRELQMRGVVSEARRDELLGFPWYHTVVLHEAGVPPLHTPAAVLAMLPTEIKRRLYLVHIAEKDVPKDSGLRTAKVGVENTIRIPVERPQNADAIELLDVFCSIDIFNGFSISRAREVLQIARRGRYPQGTKIIQQGTEGETFYIIVSGEVTVVYNGKEIKTQQAGDFFGETSLVLGQPRLADVVARTDVDLIEIDRQDFLYLIRGTNISERLTRLARMRDEHSWEVFDQNSVLRNLSSAQKTQLQTYLESSQVNTGDVLWQAGQRAEEAVIVDDASIKLEADGGALDPFFCGAFVGEADALRADGVLTTVARVVGKGRIFRICREDLNRFFQDNPGVLVSFLGTRFVE